MSSAPSLLLASLAGMALGALFFGGLWWTVRRVVAARQPALWVLASMLVRTGIALVGFYLVADARLGRLLACLLGFVVARVLVMRLTRSLQQPSVSPEASHAP